MAMRAMWLLLRGLAALAIGVTAGLWMAFRAPLDTPEVRPSPLLEAAGISPASLRSFGQPCARGISPRYLWRRGAWQVARFAFERGFDRAREVRCRFTYFAGATDRRGPQHMGHVETDRTGRVLLAQHIVQHLSPEHARRSADSLVALGRRQPGARPMICDRPARASDRRIQFDAPWLEAWRPAWRTDDYAAFVSVSEAGGRAELDGTWTPTAMLALTVTREPAPLCAEAVRGSRGPDF